MHNNVQAEGLASKFQREAVKVAVFPSLIKSTSPVNIPSTQPFNNDIEWTNKALAPGAAMELLDGYHQMTLIQSLYKKDTYALHKLKIDKLQAATPWKITDHQKNIDQLHAYLLQHAMWLVEFYDICKLFFVYF